MMRVFIISAVAMVVALASVVPPAIQGDASTQLKLLTTVDGKSYFIDTELRNWTTASEYCQSLGMELGSITTLAEAKALNSSYKQDEFESLYWTSGREAFEIREFTWNSTDQPIEASIIDYRGEYYRYQYRTCILYYSYPVDSYLLSYDCGLGARTLCETQ